MHISDPMGTFRTAARPRLVVHVARQFHPGVGGVEAFVASLAREQLKMGHEVRVVTLDRIFHANRGRLPPQEVLDGVEVRRVPSIGSPRYPIAPWVLAHIRDAGIVHVHGTDFLFDYLAATKRFHKKKLVLSTHGGYFHTEFAKLLKRALFATITRWSLSQYDYVAASSVQDEQTFRRIRSRDIGPIENGVDIEKFRDCGAKTPLRRVLTFGRLAPHKDVPALFPFLRALRQLDGDWKLTVAGTPQGIGFEELGAAATAAVVRDSVDLVDSPSDQRLRELISLSSVFASASRYEGFGMAPIEALSAGLFPVLSDIPPHRRTIEATAVGSLVTLSDPQRAAESFLRAWRDWCADFPAHRARAIRSVERYAWPAVAKRFDEVYRALMGGQVIGGHRRP